MKKLVFILAMLAGAIMAQAGDYAYLVFVNQSNDTTVMSVTDLTMTVNDNALTVTNTEKTVNFTLTDLRFMQFMTEDGEMADALDALNADAPIDVYTLQGFKAGRFGSLREAAAVLGKGSYVITDGKNSQTIVLQ